VKGAEDKTTSERDVDTLKKWVTDRIAWCDTHFGYTAT
jgi:hypothetical protein